MLLRSRALRAAVTVGVLLAVTACGSDEGSTDSAAGPAAASTTADVASSDPGGPAVAQPAVAPMPTGIFVDDAYATFGQDAVRAAYDEMVGFATTDSFDPGYFLWDGTNTTADLDAVAARIAPDKVAGFRMHADNCFSALGCEPLWHFVYAGLGTPEAPYTFLPDGTFVVDQTISNPEVFIPEGDGGELVVSFRHVADAHVLIAGAPHRLGMTRTAQYTLVPAPEGSDAEWLISEVYADFTGSDLEALPAA